MKQTNTSLIVGLTFVATLGGLLFGYDTAVISGAVSSIDANFIDPLNVAETARSSLSGWTVSSALFLVSAAGSGYPELGLGPSVDARWRPGGGGREQAIGRGLIPAPS